MAIVDMRKLNLIAMSYDKDAVLDALHRTNAAEVTLHADTENTTPLVCEGEELKAYLATTENALNVLCNAVDNRQKEEKIKSDLLKDGFDVSYSDFLAAKERKAEMDDLVAQITALADEKNRLKGELSKAIKQKELSSIYASLATPFGAFAGSAHTKGRLGVVSLQNKDVLSQALAEQELCDFETLGADNSNVLLYVVAHKSVTAETDGILSTYGFTECPYDKEKCGKDVHAENCAKETSVKRAIEENADTMYALKEQIRPLKIYCDYVSFLLEKENAKDKLRATDKTFLLQAYVPAPSEEDVKAELASVSGAIYMEFSDPTEEDEPPTLLKNNSIVSNFESITNTYSVPNYREFDPNAVMSFFYSLFMGFIIGDAGYGLLMLVVGGYLWLKNRKRPTGMSRLAGAFAVGGIFAIIWGLLFNSTFGFAVLPVSILPNPQDFEYMWTFVGIRVPPVLIIAMLVGITQLCAGYFCKAVQEWRRGHVVDGIFDGLIWSFFSVGVMIAIVGLIEEAGLPKLALIGGITAGASLLIAMVTAGRKEKFFGKFTKGFGAAYGVINYVSDILSYARLYGLMLAGAVIAGIIAKYGGGFVVSGNIGFVILGVVLLVVGNLFNLVISLLGAYIHDARLQYVEFYGRFYEGDGELFKPLGSERKYIYLLPAKEAEAQKA